MAVSRASMNYTQDRIAGMRVLVVDPNPQLRNLIRDILLRGIGVHEVYEAGNGEEALSVLHDLTCDLVIADTAMEPVGALEMTFRIRKGMSRIDPYLPVIIMSAHAKVEEILKARDLGANEYIAKPLSAKILDLRLHALVEKPRPFVRSDNFFGPDRRRHANHDFEGTERRQSQD